MTDPNRSLWDDPNAPWHARDEPQEGYTRVWFDAENFLDYSADDVEALYVDNQTSGFRIQPDPWRLDAIDEEEITISYAHGAEYRVRLGAIGQPTGVVDRYVFDAGLILPATSSLEVSLSEHYVPRLFLLRMAIHEAVRDAIADRVELAAIAAAFAQIIGINSSGTTPTTGRDIARLIEIANHAHD